jgi:hypothetical protein
MRVTRYNSSTRTGGMGDTLCYMLAAWTTTQQTDRQQLLVARRAAAWLWLPLCTCSAPGQHVQWRLSGQWGMPRFLESPAAMLSAFRNSRCLISMCTRQHSTAQITAVPNTRCRIEHCGYSLNVLLVLLVPLFCSVLFCSVLFCSACSITTRYADGLF